jgi:hypothetical protein
LDRRDDPAREVSRRVASELGPAWSVTVRGETVVVRKQGSAHQKSVEFAGLRQSCSGMSPQEREEMLAEAVRLLVASARDPNAGPAGRLRDADWCLPRLFPFLLSPSGQRRLPAPLVHRPCLPGLDVGCVVVDPDAGTLTPVTEQDARAWGRSEDDLHGAALGNLAQHPVVPRIMGPGPAVLIHSDGWDNILSAAQVLLEATMRDLARTCGSDALCVALPASDAAVAWPTGSPRDAPLRASAARLYHESTDRLLQQPILWVRGRWSPR